MRTYFFSSYWNITTRVKMINSFIQDRKVHPCQNSHSNTNKDCQYNDFGVKNSNYLDKMTC